VPTEKPIKQNFENITSLREKTKVSKKFLILFSSVFASTLVILLTIAIILGFKQPQIKLIKLLEKEKNITPTPRQEVTQEISNPSSYATDSAILEIEQDLKEIDKQLQETDLKEASLNPPLLDMDIEFKIED